MTIPTLDPAPATAPAAAAPHRLHRRRGVGILGDVVLWIAAAAGLLCIVVVIAALVFHVTLIMFKTGSMEPTIPTGSLAVVREIPAGNAKVGDIVTVDRPGQLPVTHRVTSVSGTGDSRSITLRGDANPTDDLEPYQVSTVRTVVAWVPGLARVIVWFGNPFVLGGLTLACTALVTWAFWPRGPRHRPRSTNASGAVVAGLLIGSLAGAVAPPDVAHAAETETIVQSTYLRLTSVSDLEEWGSLSPQRPVSWQVGVESFPPDPGELRVGLAATGDLAGPGDMSVTARSCAVRWVAGTCASGEQPMLATTDLATASGSQLGEFAAGGQRWLQLTLTMLDPAATPGERADLVVRVEGSGDSAGVGAGGESQGGSRGIGSLAATGQSVVLAPLLALAAVGLGLLLAGVARRRRRAAP